MYSKSDPFLVYSGTFEMAERRLQIWYTFIDRGRY